MSSASEKAAEAAEAQSNPEMSTISGKTVQNSAKLAQNPDFKNGDTPAEAENDQDNNGGDVEDEDEINEEDEEPPAKKKKKKRKKNKNNNPDKEAKSDRNNDHDDNEDNNEEEEEIVTLTVGKKPMTGMVWRSTETGECTKYHCDSYDVDYKIGDAVYIESQRSDQPYYICVIQEMKLTKRDTLTVHIKWFYRTSEVPEQVYQLLIQDRYTEHGAGAASSAVSNLARNLAAIKDPMYRTRELFISEMTDIYPASVLRGLCNVQHCLDIKAIKEFKPVADAFFYTLSYNPETRRLASTQGEIRVGASHQAKLPPYEGDLPVEKRPEPWGEEITWCPERIHDHDLIMFLRAARSMAAFAAMCDGGSPDEGFQTASKDGITAKAIQKLHECDYDTGSALQGLVKIPFPNHDVFRKWPEEDVKNFIKGLRVHGKNFFKIRVEYLPERDTSDLIEFYYLWKKTTGAANNRPRGRRHRPNVMRRIKTGKGSNKTPKDDPNDLSSCSDPENEEEEEGEAGKNGEEEISPYYCRHCFTTSSKDWHHAGKEKLLLCTECRIYFKRYADYPPLDGEVKKREAEQIKRQIDEAAAAELRTAEAEKAQADLLTSQKPNQEISGELNLSAIEQDVKREDSLRNHQMEPVEMKAELPKNVRGIFSPVALSGSSSSNPNISPNVSRTSEVQVISEHHMNRHPSGGNHHGSGLNSLPIAPREPSPPPKPDGSECHRSQSAIFTRMWNRGEGNSCSRTDMIFKPVPDSKLARKREERLRKAAEREEALKVEAAKRAHQEAFAGGAAGAHAPPGHPLFSPTDPFRVSTPSSLHHRPSPFPPGHPLAPPPDQRSIYPPGFAPAPPPSPLNSPGNLLNVERRRLEEMAARASAERQYAERMSALATDPLVRLQMAGVNPEIPGASHFAHPFGLRSGGPPPPGIRPPPGLDPRFRSDLFLRQGYLSSPDILQRQLMMEREHSILAAHQSAAAAQQSLLAQQEEFFRLEQEARARQAASRP